MTGRQGADSPDIDGFVIDGAMAFKFIRNAKFIPNNFDCDEFIEEMQYLRKKYFALPAAIKRTLSHAGNDVWIGLGLNLAMRLHNKPKCALDFMRCREQLNV